MSVLRMTYDEAKRQHRMSLVIDEDDLMHLRFDGFDKIVLDTPAANAADHLQSAELIVRRLIQQGIAFVPAPEATDDASKVVR